MSVPRASEARRRERPTMRLREELVFRRTCTTWQAYQTHNNSYDRAEQIPQTARRTAPKNEKEVGLHNVDLISIHTHTHTHTHTDAHILHTYTFNKQKHTGNSYKKTPPTTYQEECQCWVVHEYTPDAQSMAVKSTQKGSWTWGLRSRSNEPLFKQERNKEEEQKRRRSGRPKGTQKTVREREREKKNTH
jgi:hypothetical protein